MHCNMICGRLGWYLDPINIFSCSRRSQKASRIQLVRCQQHLTQNSGTYRNTTNQNCLKRNSFISPHLHPCTYVDSVSLMLHYPSISELFFPLPLSWRSSQCVKCDVRPSCCSSIMIFLVELSITQQALMRHESAIRSTDNCIFLFRNKVARPVGINLNGDFDWCNERVVSHWDWRCSMVPCLPLTQSEEEVVFWRGWKASEVGQLLLKVGAVQSKGHISFFLKLKTWTWKMKNGPVLKVLLRERGICIMYNVYLQIKVTFEHKAVLIFTTFIYRNLVHVWHFLSWCASKARVQRFL